MIWEAYLVLKSGGWIIVGFIDKDSSLGQEYEAKRASNGFYRGVTFYSARQVIRLLEETGFCHVECRQTLHGPPGEITAPDPVRAGYGEGAFVVLSALKPEGR